jgi:exonuclease SbcC
VDEAGKAADAARRALADLLEAVGLGAADDLADVIAAALAERSAKEAEVHLLERRLADLEQLVSDEAELVGSTELLRRIHGDLAPSKFLEFVLDERRRILGDLASEHFEHLSAGRYRFDEDGEFQVVDLTSADAIRAPASLSGGETFLASLALALALAEIVSREGGRLDAFFLDEGFGSLDPEHLDLAMGGVERLVTSGPDRLVVIVSHVPALTERIEDLLVLDRDPMTGETRVVSGASGS